MVLLKKLLSRIILCIALALITYCIIKHVKVITTDISWIKELNFDENEVHKLSFHFPGIRGCPQIPVTINDKNYTFIFDTGCGAGFSITNALENKMQYDILGRTEEYNRDGGYRGWTNVIKIEDDITFFDQSLHNVVTTIANWKMYSVTKFNGLIGLKYFDSKVIALDYKNKRIAITDKKVDYSKLGNEYICIPLLKSTEQGKNDLVFFEAKYENKPACIYLDTGTNHSFLWNKNSEYSFASKQRNYKDITIEIGDNTFNLEGVIEINDLAQNDGLPHPIAVALNSDKIKKLKILVVFDLIDQKLILKKL
ncbi:aspartyl protease family protein [Sedimentibacter sp. zth1]|uniref:aspartyl protease family protein n=1 Tax=Sedimentibacter sp. zth1 TaxID=2816908 RepID=UPI001A932623|nr:aspartyl protease family protein [Sedimentibacter sp. zth1]QSX06248.1 aspartyl protease family protein [Sedimentibacter sp. zth1]